MLAEMNCKQMCQHLGMVRNNILAWSKTEVPTLQKKGNKTIVAKRKATERVYTICSVQI